MSVSKQINGRKRGHKSVFEREIWLCRAKCVEWTTEARREGEGRLTGGVLLVWQRFEGNKGN